MLNLPYIVLVVHSTMSCNSTIVLSLIKQYSNHLFVVIMGPTTGTTFKGFMIQARRMADNSPVGMFAFDGLNFKAQCTGNVRLSYTQYISHVLCMYSLCNVVVTWVLFIRK